MNLKTLSQGEPWMTPEERALNHDFVRTTTERLASHGVPETPLVVLRVNDVIVTWLLARRLEAALTPEPGEPAPCPTPTQAGAIGKCRDRLRRAMKELEACYPRETPAKSDPNDHIKPTTQPQSEPTPPSQTPGPDESQPTDSEALEKHDRPKSAKIDPTNPTNTPQPIEEPASLPPAPAPPPCPAPTPPTSDAAQPTRRKRAQKKRRKKRGIPIRARAS